ncbi:S9 family peptidase [Rhodocytophaga aerolata]|uniref:S9 family peptidase n=1 Tax=Rhodocytophaga aerolata TaxID=455078 RepID=A0ABT8QZN2_9BACT|nr:S9 family peptidase [Rhodocytophaga aerolata]MDO1445306.1 S9 family peptidase [Rhodocytophaga aerolata]
MRVQVNAPKAKEIPKILTTHGQDRTDKYYWLRDRENPEVITYLEAENKYLDTVMAHTKPLQEKLFNEMKGRIKEKDESAPFKDGNYYYYYRYEEGFEYPIHCRKKGSLEATEEIILNENDMAKGHDYFDAAGLEVSDDEQILAYAVDTVSRRLYTLQFKNLATGKFYPEIIQDVDPGFAWASDSKSVFYVKKDTETLLPFQVYKHVLGTDPKTDKLVYEEEDDTFYTSLFRTKSKKYIMLHIGSTLSSEMHYLDASRPEDKFTVVLPREEEHEYTAEHLNDQFYILTNWQAQNFRLMEVPVAKSADKKAWKEVIPHRKEVYLDNFELFKNHLVLNERKEGLLHMRIIRWQDKGEHYLDFGEPAYLAYTDINPEMDTPKLRYGYTSLTTPGSVYEYDMETKEKKLLKQQEVQGGFTKENYVSERVYATARDGVKIPISLVYRKGINKDGNNPLYQYSYGSYGISSEATFSSSRLSLLDRGFIFAIVHIRGGQEMGRQWYEDGKLLKKKNTFTDFIDCSEFLIKEKYTNPEKLVAMGGSAGGLLMGAVVNMRPDLYKAVVAHVPFVDVMTTMLDESIPLTTGEYDEWGNPNTKEYFDYMLSYSPYDNVKKQAYPNMLVTTGLHDSQVQYWEPAKWVAKLRTMKTDNNLLLMYTNMEAGHGGASGRFKKFYDTAREYAFIMDVLGMQEKEVVTTAE